MTRKGAEVPEIEWCEPGENAALDTLMGVKNGFLTTRLKSYSKDRNNPLKPKGLSGISPYLHFGQIAAQRCALEARKVRTGNAEVCGAIILLFLRFFLFSVGVRSLFLLYDPIKCLYHLLHQSTCVFPK